MGKETFATSMQRLQGDLVKKVTGYRSLKSFIRELRACASQGAERALIAKELASIRTALKSTIGTLPSVLAIDFRWQSIAKLVYCAMIAPEEADAVAFAQVEAVKLTGGPRLRDKRLGYLAVAQLLDEQQAPLTLVTNSLKSDLEKPPNGEVLNLALQALATVGSRDVARDLADAIAMRLCDRASDAGVRKRAAGCALALVRLDPELGELFSNAVQEWLTGGREAAVPTRRRASAYPGEDLVEPLASQHAVLITAAQLLAALVPECLRLLDVDAICAATARHLKRLCSGRDSPDLEVGGVNDPFLQCALLALLRRLVEESASPLHRHRAELNDALTAVSAQQADCSTMSQYAVSLDCIRCVLAMAAETRQLADPALVSMSIVALAKFLTSSDADIRFVALSTLNDAVRIGSMRGAIVKHQKSILGCLTDASPGIRHGAISLALAIVSPENIEQVVPAVVAAEESAPMHAALAVVAAQHAPSDSWYIDFMLRLIKRRQNAQQLVLSLLETVRSRGCHDELLLKCRQQPDARQPDRDAGCTGLSLLCAYVLGEWGAGPDDLARIAELRCSDEVRAVAIMAAAKIIARTHGEGAKKRPALPPSIGTESERVRRVLNVVLAEDPGALGPEVAAPRPKKSIDEVLALLSTLPAASRKDSVSAAVDGEGFTTGWDDESVRVRHKTLLRTPSMVKILFRFSDGSLSVQCAVPRAYKLTMLPPEGAEQTAVIETSTDDDWTHLRIKVRVLGGDGVPVALFDIDSV